MLCFICECILWFIQEFHRHCKEIVFNPAYDKSYTFSKRRQQMAIALEKLYQEQIAQGGCLIGNFTSEFDGQELPGCY